MNLDVVVIGRVVEIEPDAVEVAQFKAAPMDRRNKYKVAIVKVDEPLLSASGITRVRVGLLADDPESRLALATGQEGCFLLAKHPTADFCVPVMDPILRKGPGYGNEVERLKKYTRVLNDPVAALQAKGLDDRFEAARFLLQRYLIPRDSTAREPIPDEENKLILDLLAELPWTPPEGNAVRPDGRLEPNRSALWHSINAGEFGFQLPVPPKPRPGAGPTDQRKLMDEATTKFLKENGNKIQLKRFVQK